MPAEVRLSYAAVNGAQAVGTFSFRAFAQGRAGHCWVNCGIPNLVREELPPKALNMAVVAV